MFITAISALAFALVAQCQTYEDPVRNPGADPFMVTTGGYYYLTNTQTTFISVTRSTTLGGLITGDTRTVWTDTNSTRDMNMWAPEMHLIDGIWHIFYSAGDAQGNQRSWVLQGCDLNPYDCNYTFLADLTPPAGGRGGADLNDAYSIDGTYLTIGDGRYHVVSAHNGTGFQCIQITAINTTSWTVGPWSIISSPTEPWEMADPIAGQPVAVNEGPNPLYHGGRTWLSFSASFCATPTYALGLLAYDGCGNPLDAASWTKSGPVLSAANGNYGTGHNGFFSSPDGTEVWNAYHATANSSGSCGADRYTNAEIVNFDACGNPVFPIPAKDGTPITVPSGDGS